MNIYVNILVEFLLISSSILFLFKFRKKLGLAPLYLVLGAVQCVQTLSGTMISLEVFGKYTLYPGSVILFSSVLFAVLLIYIKEGVSSARILIVGIIISNFILSALFEITFQQQLSVTDNQDIKTLSVFLINYKYFITGTIILLVDFFLLAIIYQLLITKIKQLPYFLVLFIALFSVLLFDAFAFNILLNYGSPDFKESLISHVIGKTISSLIFSIILYSYLKFIDRDKKNTSFIASQERDVFSIFRLRKKYLDLKVEKQQVEQRLTSQLETSLNNISDGFISLDKNWCYTYINKNAGKFLGRTPDSLIGKHIWTEFPEGIDLPFYKAYYKAVETQQTIYFEEYYEPFNKWFENRIYPSSDGLTIYFTDVTEKKKADINNQILLSLIETSDDFVGIADLEGRPIYLNSNGRKLVGLDINEKIPSSISDFFPENYRETIAKEHIPHIFEKNSWSGEAQFQNIDTGGIVPIEMSGFLIKDKTTSNPIALGIVASNITKRKAAEEKLINSELLFRRVSSNAPVAIFQADIEGSCNYVNDEWIEYSGQSFDEAMDFGWTNAIHPEDKDAVVNEWLNSISNKKEFVMDFRLIHKNGKITLVSTKAVVLYDGNDEIHGYVGMLLDITERKKAEEQLIKSELLFRELSSNAPVAIFQTDVDGACGYVNEEWMKYAGMSFEEAMGFGWANAIHPEDKERVLNEWQESVVSKNDFISDYRFQTKKNITTWLSAKAVGLYDAENNLYGYIGMALDITERKEAELALMESENHIRTILETEPECIKQLNAKGELIYMNPAGLAMIEADSLEMIKGQSIMNLILPEHRKAFKKLNSQIFKGQSGQLEFEIKGIKGTNRWLETHAVPFKDTDGNIISLLGVTRDVTDRKIIENELIKSEKYLESIINNIGDPVFVKDEQSHFILANKAFYNLFNRTKEEIIGKTFAKSVPLEERERYLRNDKKVISKGIESIVEDSFIDLIEENRFISTKKTRFIDESGEKYLIGSIRDITKSKKAEEQIIKSEKYLENIINNIGDPVFVKDEESKLILINDAFCHYFQVSRTNAIGKTLAEELPLDEMEGFLRIDKQVLDTGIENTNEENITIRGETRKISTNKARFIDESGNKFLIGTIRDITERYKSEEVIRVAHQRLTTHLNNSPLAIIEWDKHSLIRNWSVQAENIFGWKASEVIGKHYKDLNLVHKDDIAIIDDALVDGKVKSNRHVNRNYTKSNSIIYCEWYNSVLKSPDGEIETIFSLVQDVTERKNSQEALKTSEARFRAMVDSSPIGIFFVQRDGNVSYSNEADMRMTGLTIEETLGLKWIKAVHPEDKEKSMKDWVTAMDAGIAYRGKGRYLHKDGKIVFWDLMTAPVIIDREVTGFIGMVLDITEKVKSEEEISKYKNHLEKLVDLRTDQLEKEKVKAQSADLMKSAFLATMSHELRTPMNSIIGFTGILINELAGPLNDEQKKQLGMVKNSGEHLLGLINDILDISKIEAGKLKVSNYPFSYSKTLQTTVDFLIPQVSAKNLKLTTQIDEIDITLISDERRVEQILLNLLSNAIKFSKKGSILVKVAVKDDMLITQVIDEGIGIDKKDLVKLFMPFIQLEGGLSRSHEGTGLGLAICKKLIEKLGGSIDVVSQLGKGSNFTFKLPLEYTIKEQHIDIK